MHGRNYNITKDNTKLKFEDNLEAGGPLLYIFVCMKAKIERRQQNCQWRDIKKKERKKIETTKIYERE